MIFLSPGSEEELERRLMSRKSEDIEKLKLRVQTARGEMLRLSEFDYVVDNLAGELDATVDVIEAIICAEHHRVVPRKVNL
jgi:guanylate kinase